MFRNAVESVSRSIVQVVIVSKAIKIPVQDTYTVSNLVKLFGYTRQSIAKAIREVCPNAEKTPKGYRLTLSEAQSIAAYYSIKTEVVSECEQEPKDTDELKLIRETVSILKKQLEEKDAQIAALNSTVAELVQSNKALSANATMHTAKQMQDEQEELDIVPQNQNKTFLQKLKELFS